MHFFLLIKYNLSIEQKTILNTSQVYILYYIMVDLFVMKIN